MAIDPSKKSAAVDAMVESWALIDALLGGTPAMRKAGPRYLPPFPREDRDAYQTRLAQAVLFPAFARTTATLAAKPLSRPIGLKNVASSIEPMLGNVDVKGTPLAAFVAQIIRAVLSHGLDGVLVDMPPANGARTIAEEKAAGLRPYLARYGTSSILGWRAQQDANGAYLTQLRLLEKVTEPAGDFEDKTIDQVRILEPGSWQVWRKIKTTKGTEEWALHESGETSLKIIPFVFFYGIELDFGIGAPPLLDLAHLNVRHWQSWSDQENVLHVARVPVLFGKSFSEDDELVIGASTAIRTSNDAADLKYVEHSGEAIEAGRKSIIDLEDRMRQAGAELTVQRPAVVTATQVRSDDEGNRSTLQQIAEGAEDGIARCLQLMGEFVGEKSQPEVELFKDFASEDLSEKGGDLLLRAAKDGHVSSETVFDHLKRMDIIAQGMSWEQEKKRLAQSRPAIVEGEINDV